MNTSVKGTNRGMEELLWHFKHVVLVSMVIMGEANGCVTPYASRSQKAYEIKV